VQEVVDVLHGRAVTPDGTTRGLELPSSDVLGFRLGAGRAWVRPSGTEPKIKLYAEIVEPVSGDVAAARAVADGRAREVLAALEAALALDAVTPAGGSRSPRRSRRTPAPP
jgi:phosphomannomutase